MREDRQWMLRREKQRKMGDTRNMENTSNQWKTQKRDTYDCVLRDLANQQDQNERQRQ